MSPNSLSLSLSPIVTGNEKSIWYHKYGGQKKQIKKMVDSKKVGNAGKIAPMARRMPLLSGIITFVSSGDVVAKEMSLEASSRGCVDGTQGLGRRRGIVDFFLFRPAASLPLELACTAALLILSLGSRRLLESFTSRRW